MEILTIILLFGLGLLLIIKGGDIFVDAASWFAVATGIPKFIVGATVVSLVTTLPELLVSVMGVLSGTNDIAIGNAIGSVTANTALIMALSMIAMPFFVEKISFREKGILMLLSCALLLLFCADGQLASWEGMLILLVLVAFGVAVYLELKKEAKSEKVLKKGIVVITKKEILVNIVKFILGAAGIVIGARLLVDNGSAMATAFHVPQSIIGLTLVAVGTSLPELVTTVTAIVKKESSMSIGNVLGANIIDMTMILPICSFVSGGNLAVAKSTILFDIPFCLAVMAVATIPTFIKGRLYRWQGIALIAMYGTYLYFIICR